MFKPITSKTAQTFAELEAKATAQLDREHAMVRALLDQVDQLDARERSFVRSCWAGRTGLGLALSDAQYRWICDLAKRLELSF